MNTKTEGTLAIIAAFIVLVQCAGGCARLGDCFHRGAGRIWRL